MDLTKGLHIYIYKYIHICMKRTMCLLLVELDHPEETLCG